MKFSSKKRVASWLICMMLSVTMVFSMVGCGSKGNDTNNDSDNKQSATEQPQVNGNNENDENNQDANDKDADQSENDGNKDEAKDKVLGEGQTKFMCNVVDSEGNETNFEIHTDKETVGEALLEVELIAGEEGDYGLYVKEVNGITADYDVDKTYWAFYIDGEYASTGVDSTKVEEGKTYTFKIEK